MVYQHRSRQWILLAVTLCLSQGISGQTLTNLTDLTVQSGAALTVEGDLANEGSGEILLDGTLLLGGDLTNNSSTLLTSGTGECALVGSSPQTIDGSNSSRFSGLTQNNASGTILNQTILVDGILLMTSGTIDLNGQTLDLGATGEISGETDANRIFGTSGSIEALRDLNGPSGDNIAGMGVAITSAVDMGSTTITRSHAALAVGSGTSIERTFDIQPTNNTGLDATLRIEYFDSELNGQDPNALIQWRQANGAANWTPGLATSSGSGFVEGTPYSFMALWTLSADGTSSLKDQLPALSARAYPNPLSAGEQLSLEGLDIGSYDLLLHDVHGRTVWKSHTTIASTDMIQRYELPTLSEGMYTLQVLSTTHTPFTTQIRIHTR